MDLSKSISYRGLELNGAKLETGRTLRGLAVENVDYSTIDVAGYTEKRAAADGIHASDVYLGARRVELSGLVYAADVAELFDYLHVLRSVFSPTSAYQADPGARGFLPLHYTQSTKDVVSFPEIPGPPLTAAGTVPLYMNLRPQQPVRFSMARDRQDTKGTNHGKRPSATPWATVLIAKDPRVYIDPAQSIPVAGGTTAPTWLYDSCINRGDYETPLNIMLVVLAAPAAGYFRIYFAGVDMTITIEAKPNTVYRWFGDDRVLMTEAVAPDGTSLGSPLILRMDLVRFDTKNRRPTVPASINPPTRPFSTGIAYMRSVVTLAAGSRMFWSEAFA